MDVCCLSISSIKLPVGMKVLPIRPYLPPPPARINGTLNADTLAIMYIVLVHSHADFAIRIIEALNEPQHTFVIHVDLKAADVQETLSQYTIGRDNIYVLQHYREIVNWGGYSVVNATLNAMHVAWNMGRHFDYLIDISGTSYPIKSNKKIRETFAKQPNAVYMDIVDEPSVPPADVSCDCPFPFCAVS
jgi:Core-2/I-Branching enzyme